MVVARQGDDGRLTRVASLAALRKCGVMVVKAGGKQIALFHSDAGVHACNNRCPHEGYPLAEGVLTDGCILTCNWHNWKFDLERGETLVGGDALRCYPVVVRGDDIWLDLTDPPPAEVAARALSALREAMSDMAYDRMAREIARLRKAGADPADALRAAVRWTFDRFEYGATHAHAAAADWLTLGHRRYATDPAAKLVPVVETVAHLAWDSLREPAYPFTSAVRNFDADAFVAAVDREDEESAVAMIRGALAAGMSYADVEPALARAALAHYTISAMPPSMFTRSGSWWQRSATPCWSPCCSHWCGAWSMPIGRN